MSGICGILSIGGPDPTEQQIRSLTAAMARRGPDRLDHWRQGRAALGHALLATTPEALTELLPLTLGDCTITADVRLDNREELIAALDLNPAPSPIGDGELILRAYAKWGEHCPNHLLGDFAFAIWDAGAGKLFCARDHMGMRQLIHCHVPGALFAFATDVEALFAVPGVPRHLNQGRIADFLIDLEGLDFTSTFYEEIVRLPPAHSMTFQGGVLDIARYWALRAPLRLNLSSHADYAAAFLPIFTEAVRCRLRGSAPIGAMLSGGMDSSSIAAVAGDLLAATGGDPLQTFSVVGPDPAGCPETAAIMAAAAIPHIRPEFIDHSDLGPRRRALVDSMDEAREPFDGHMGLIRAIYQAARAKHVKVVLDGVAGDVALHAGNRVASLLRAGRIAAAWREASGEAAFWKTPSHRLEAFIAAAWVAWAPQPIRLAKRHLAWWIADLRLYRSKALRPEFVRKTRLVDRRRRFRGHAAKRDLPPVEQRTQLILHPHLVVGRERYDRVAAAFGIEPRDPFMDIRLIEFCLSVPADIIQNGGWPKMLLRKAMEDKLPEAVVWRHGKESLGHDFTRSIFSKMPGWHTDAGRERICLGEFVRDGTLRDIDQAEAKDDDRMSFDLYYLARWLKRSGR